MRTKAVQSKVCRSDDGGLLDRMKTIKTEHPFWGYRRVRAWLVHREKIVVNQKGVYRLMREHGLMAIQTVDRAKTIPQRDKPRADSPRQLLEEIFAL